MNYDTLLNEVRLKDTIPDWQKKYVKDIWGDKYLDFQIPDPDDFIEDGEYELPDSIKNQAIEWYFKFDFEDLKAELRKFLSEILENPRFLDYFEQSEIDKKKPIDIREPWLGDIARLFEPSFYAIAAKQTRIEGRLALNLNQQVNINKWIDSYNRATGESIYNPFLNSHIAGCISRIKEQTLFDFDLFSNHKLYLYVTSRPVDKLSMSVSRFYTSCIDILGDSDPENEEHRTHLLSNVFDKNMKVAFLVFDAPYFDRKGHRHRYTSFCRAILRKVEGTGPKVYIDQTYPPMMEGIFEETFENLGMRFRKKKPSEVSLDVSFMGGLPMPKADTVKFKAYFSDVPDFRNLQYEQLVNYLAHKPMQLQDVIHELPYHTIRLVVSERPNVLSEVKIPDENLHRLIEQHPYYIRKVKKEWLTRELVQTACKGKEYGPYQALWAYENVPSLISEKEIKAILSDILKSPAIKNFRRDIPRRFQTVKSAAEFIENHPEDYLTVPVALLTDKMIGSVAMKCPHAIGLLRFEQIPLKTKEKFYLAALKAAPNATMDFIELITPAVTKQAALAGNFDAVQQYPKANAKMYVRALRRWQKKAKLDGDEVHNKTPHIPKRVQTPEIVELCVKLFPTSIGQFENVPDKLKWYVFRKYGIVGQIPDPPEELQKKAVAEGPWNLKELKSPTEKVILYAVSLYPKELLKQEFVRSLPITLQSRIISMLQKRGEYSLICQMPDEAIIVAMRRHPTLFASLAMVGDPSPRVREAAIEMDPANRNLA